GDASQWSRGHSRSRSRRPHSEKKKPPGWPVGLANLTRTSGNVLAAMASDPAADLDTFFRPRTVAVLGASDTPNKPTSAMTRKIRAWSEQFGAAFFPVNPNREQVDGLPCFASINDVPDDIDLAVILTGNAVQSFEAVVER